MATCTRCGAQLPEDASFCSVCGTPVAAAPAGPAAAPQTPPQTPPGAGTPPQQQTPPAYGAAVPPPPPPGQSYAHPAPPEVTFDPKDVQDNKAMGVLSYIGFLVLVPLLAAKGSPFARFHANQGLVLFIAELAVSIVLGILGAILGFFWIGWLVRILSSLCGILFLVFSILGIVNAAGGKAKELPLIGHIRLIN